MALGVVLMDLLLSGDNAIVIALACRGLRPALRPRALILGVVGALLTRMVFTSCANLLMQLPLLKFIGGVTLLKISLDLVVNNHGVRRVELVASDSHDLWAAAKTIVLADIVMSLDNVLALSAVTQNNWQMLLLGLLLSLPMLMFSSVYVSRLLDTFPNFLWLGAAILGGVAGRLMADEQALEGVFGGSSSVTNLLLPLVCAAFVVLMSRVISTNRQHMQDEARPVALFDIFWPRELVNEQQENHRLPKAAKEAVRLDIAASNLELLAPTPSQQAEPRAALPVPAASAEHRIFIALGIFMAICLGVGFYLMTAYQPSEVVASGAALNYQCNRPSLAIALSPDAKLVHLSTADGSVDVPLVNHKIMWQDYEQAKAQLGFAPPLQIALLTNTKMVVDGGVYSNADCYLTK
jgi:YjbE family integral membrane protein